MKIKYKPWAKVLMYLVEAIVIILSVFPILWVIMSSFKTNGEILSSPLALPAHFSLDTFIDIFQKYSFPTYFFNSLLAAGVSTLVSLLFCAMGAYVIAKFEFPGRKLLFALFTITLLVPSHSKTQPIFSLITKLNLYDSIWGVTLVYLSAGMAMSIFVLKAGFMISNPAAGSWQRKPLTRAAPPNVNPSLPRATAISTSAARWRRVTLIPTAALLSRAHSIRLCPTK